MPTLTRSVAEVAVAGTLDALVISPRPASEAPRVRALLEQALPGIRLGRRAEGFVVDAWEAHVLLAIPEETGLVWRPEAKRFVENRRRVKAAQVSVQRRTVEIKVKGFEFAKGLVSDLTDIETLDRHQVVNVAAMAVPEGYGLCVFDEQGVGKTVTFIYAFDLLVQRDRADVALVVAPKSMVPEWPQDLVRFKGDLYKFALLTGSRRDKVRALSSGADFFVTNFETAITMEAELRAFLRGHGDRAVVVVDESFFI